MSGVADYRRLALALPGAIEGAHMDQPDFRVAGKIFATLSKTGAATGVVKLTREHQEMLCDAEGVVFSPVKGAWGARGWTAVDIAAADEATLAAALRTAWRTVAPKRLAATLDPR